MGKHGDIAGARPPYEYALAVFRLYTRTRKRHEESGTCSDGVLARPLVWLEAGTGSAVWPWQLGPGWGSDCSGNCDAIQCLRRFSEDPFAVARRPCRCAYLTMGHGAKWMELPRQIEHARGMLCDCAQFRGLATLVLQMESRRASVAVLVQLAVCKGHASTSSDGQGIRTTSMVRQEWRREGETGSPRDGHLHKLASAHKTRRGTMIRCSVLCRIPLCHPVFLRQSAPNCDR